ncbi:hypothetical protein BDZ91DRAFT_737843 [Kalaharituber pfeilii]|nr:hypothetical protein BDZ91DRAFT_737843 [Kalaharituber pfeilii]
MGRCGAVRCGAVRCSLLLPPDWLLATVLCRPTGFGRLFCAFLLAVVPKFHSL